MSQAVAPPAKRRIAKCDVLAANLKLSSVVHGDSKVLRHHGCSCFGTASIAQIIGVYNVFGVLKMNRRCMIRLGVLDSCCFHDYPNVLYDFQTVQIVLGVPVFSEMLNELAGVPPAFRITLFCHVPGLFYFPLLKFSDNPENQDSHALIFKMFRIVDSLDLLKKMTSI